jgi:hypothetical protein
LIAANATKTLSAMQFITVFPREGLPGGLCGSFVAMVLIGEAIVAIFLPRIPYLANAR